jgi:hypothetical protein
LRESEVCAAANSAVANRKIIIFDVCMAHFLILFDAFWMALGSASYPS